MKRFKWLTNLFLIIVFVFLSSPVYSGSAVKLFDTAGVPRGLNIDNNGRITVLPEYDNTIPADYYLYKTIVIPVISSTATIGDEVITVVSSTGVVAGHAITLYEGVNMFQSLVTGTTANTISIASPIDFAFTASALVEAGIWSMNVDGSAVTQIFSIKAPPDAKIHIHTINCSMLAATDMDDGKFGGIAALTNGILFRFIDGITKNLAVIVNNIGFWEIGFDLDYSSKAPAGQYGIRFRRDVPSINGVVVILNSGGQSKFQIHIRDDLTANDLFASTINGHMVND